MSTAPLNLDEVRACLSGNGTMLPGPAYTDSSVLAWEQQVVFAGGWTCVGRAADLAEPGRRRAVSAGDDSVLLVRGDDGVLRGFYNVCRHRGHELMPCGETGRGRFVTCPYHSWVYALDGALHKVPSEQRAGVTVSEIAMAGSATSDAAPRPSHGVGLVPVAVTEWHGFVFVNADGQAAPFEEYARGLDELVAPYRCEDLVVAAGHEYELAANWKLAIENYHECYHCSTIHPELCRVSPPESGVNYTPDGLWIGGVMDLVDGAQTMSLDGRSGATPLPGLSGPRLRQVAYLQVVPNLLLSLHPDYVMTHVLEPLAPGRTRVVCQWLFHPDAVRADGFDPAYAVDFWDLTNRQDWAACEGVQRGVASRGYVPGPLSPWHESAVYQAIAVVGQTYLDGRLPADAAVPAPR